MALRIVKYAYDHCSQLIGVIRFAVSLLQSVVMDPVFWDHALQVTACAPPSKDCIPKESNRLGATGVHSEACVPPA